MARNRYFDLDELSGEVLRDELPSVELDKDRIRCVNALSDHSYLMAGELEVFDNDRTDEDGFTPAEWERSSGRLYHLVAIADRASVDGVWGWSSLDGQAFHLSELPGVPEWCEQMASAGSIEKRAESIRDLWGLVVDEVGGQAAECLVALSTAYYQLAGKSRDEARALASRR
jgi:hypothetical protein